MDGTCLPCVLIQLGWETGEDIEGMGTGNKILWSTVTRKKEGERKRAQGHMALLVL